MTIYEAIAERVTARDAAERYGVKIGRNNRALCVWHRDTHPDLAFYDSHCYCFACGNGGDAVALTAQLFNLSMGDAAAKLNADFNLKLDMNAPTAPTEPTKAQLRQQERQRENQLWAKLCDIVHESDKRLQMFDGDMDKAWDNPEFVKIIEARSRAELALDNLWEGGKEAERIG